MSHANTDALLREVARLYIHQQQYTAACCDNTTYAQCSAITELGRSQPLTLVELSHKVGLEKSWSSRIVDGLVRDDLVMKVPHPTDGRSSLLTLTPKGEARFAALNENLNAHADRVLERIPADARPGVRHALQLLRDALRAEEDPTCAVPSLHKENHP